MRLGIGNGVNQLFKGGALAAAVGLGVAGSLITASAAATTSYSVNLPDGIQAGELLVIIVGNGDGYFGDFISPTSRDLTAPAGWNYRFGQKTGDINQNYMIFTRTADGTEGASVTFISTGNTDWQGLALRVEGADTTDPIENTAIYSGTASTQVTIPAVSSAGEALVLQVASCDFASNFTWADSTGVTDLGEMDSNSGTVAVRYYLQGAGAGTAHGITPASNRVMRHAQIAIRAAA